MLVRHLIPKVKSNDAEGGRPAKYDRREIVNAILYVARTGCQWRMLPHDFPKWKTTYRYFVLWHEAGVFEAINDRLRVDVRVLSGRKPEPSAGIIDSQSVKIVANIGYSGFDGAKKVNGRKRHIVTDTLGLLLEVVVHEASLSDRESAETILTKVHAQFKRIKIIFADQGYTGKLIALVQTTLHMTVEIIKRTEVRAFHMPIPIVPAQW